MLTRLYLTVHLVSAILIVIISSAAASTALCVRLMRAAGAWIIDRTQWLGVGVVGDPPGFVHLLSTFIKGGPLSPRAARTALPGSVRSPRATLARVLSPLTSVAN